MSRLELVRTNSYGGEGIPLSSHESIGHMPAMFSVRKNYPTFKVLVPLPQKLFPLSPGALDLS